MAKSNLDDIFGALDKLNPEAMFLSENTLSTVSNYIDTGCYSLNVVLGGTCRKGGVPEGRLTGFVGDSQTGKTYIMNKTHANAQKSGKHVVIFDSENAVDKESAINVGLDVSKVKHVPVTSIEECRNQICVLLDKIIEHKMHGKFIIGIDSLGNLCSSKELADAAANKDATDMGTRAKGLKSLLRIITAKGGRANTTIMFSNHVYDDPAQLHKSTVKTQSGGKGPIYVASVLAQLTRSNERFDEKDREKEGKNIILPNAKGFNSAYLRAFTVKNRFIPQFLEAEMFLNFKTGLEKYSGLVDLAVGYGLITVDGHTHTYRDGTVLGKKSKFEYDEEFWETKGIDDLDKILTERLAFSQEKQVEIEDADSDSDEVDEEPIIDEKVKKKSKKVVDDIINSAI